VAYSCISRNTLLTADSSADDEIDCGKLRDSGLRPRSSAASTAENNMMVVVVVVVLKVVERFEFGHNRGQRSSDGICH
jgi:hypothetical protein